MKLDVGRYKSVRLIVDSMMLLVMTLIMDGKMAWME